MKAGQEASVTAGVLGMTEATLSNWLRASEQGERQGPGDKPVCAEQMELARLRAELARVKMERDVRKKKPTRLGPPLPDRHTKRVRNWSAGQQAACFLGACVPVKKPGQGEAAGSAVVAPRVTPLRKLI